MQEADSNITSLDNILNCINVYKVSIDKSVNFLLPLKLWLTLTHSFLSEQRAVTSKMVGVFVAH